MYEVYRIRDGKEEVICTRWSESGAYLECLGKYNWNYRKVA